MFYYIFWRNEQKLWILKPWKTCKRHHFYLVSCGGVTKKCFATSLGKVLRCLGAKPELTNAYNNVIIIEDIITAEIDEYNYYRQELRLNENHEKKKRYIIVRWKSFTKHRRILKGSCQHVWNVKLATSVVLQYSCDIWMCDGETMLAESKSRIARLSRDVYNRTNQNQRHNRNKKWIKTDMDKTCG